MRAQGADVDAFVRWQFAAQARHCETVYPGADHLVVLVDGKPAGRLIVARSGQEIVIVDIALLAGSRRAGVGSAVVRGLLDEADAGRLTVRCHILAGNDDAQRFWARQGFVAQEAVGAHLAMVRAYEPAPSP